MAKIIVGDTNAVIQLAIISMVFFDPSADLEIVIHPKVIQELTGILGNRDANEEIKPYLKTLLSKLKPNTSYAEPPPKVYAKVDKRIRDIESSMDGPKSAPTDENDRLFLIIAQHNDLHLCTRESSLYNLACRVLDLGKALGVCDVIEYSLSMNLIKRDQVQEGLARLHAAGETLHRRCRENLKNLGYRLS